MNKTEILLITGRAGTGKTDFALKLTQNMKENTFLLFDGYGSDMITMILDNISKSAEKPKYIIFTSNDASSIESVAMFPYRVAHIQLQE